MKSIIFGSYSTPDLEGYNDRVSVVSDDAATTTLFHDSCSCCPNPYKVENDEKMYWRDYYGWVAPGTYSGQCVENDRFGKCILINGGGEIPSRIPNPNHNGALIITEVFIHHGYPYTADPLWRGSAGCFTMFPEVFDKFIAIFSIGEIVKIQVIDCQEMRLS